MPGPRPIGWPGMLACPTTVHLRSPLPQNLCLLRVLPQNLICTLAYSLPVAPPNPTGIDPEVRSTARSKPHGWCQRRPSLLVDCHVPTRLCFWDHEQLDGLATAARTTKPNAPVFAVVAREHKVAAWQSCWQPIALNYLKMPSWTDAGPESEQKFGQPHRAPEGSGAKRSAGRPSSGSFMPRPRIAWSKRGNASSGTCSSSPAAKLNCVLANPALPSRR